MKQLILTKNGITKITRILKLLSPQGYYLLSYVSNKTILGILRVVVLQHCMGYFSFDVKMFFVILKIKSD